MDHQPLLTAKDVAQRTGFSIRTAQRMMRSVPHINVCLGHKNQSLRITEETYEAYILERTALPPEKAERSVKLRSSSRVPVPFAGKIPRR